MKERDNSYDVLRWIALTGIIIAHSEPSIFWVQIRNFDVPLMVLVSAVCFTLSGGNFLSDKAKIQDYYKKRFIRLVLPSWIFLTFYFIISYFIGTDGVDINLKRVIMCFTLTTPWYLWIIRILLVIALIAPWLLRYTNSMSNIKLITICILGLCFGEILSCLSDNYWYGIIVMLIPYAIYYCLGINFFRFSSREILIVGILLIAFYSIIAIYLLYQTDDYVPTQEFKYPPRFYYTSYALGISAILLVYRNKIVKIIEKIHLLSFSTFVGSHTFWIYLWHIPIVESMAKHYDSLTTFIIVYFTAIVIVYVQTKLVNTVCKKIENPFYCKNIKMIFLG